MYAKYFELMQDCESSAPCVKVYVVFPGSSNSSLLHYSISDYLHFGVASISLLISGECTLNNMLCDVHFYENVDAASFWLSSNFLVPCCPTHVLIA